MWQPFAVLVLLRASEDAGRENRQAGRAGAGGGGDEGRVECCTRGHQAGPIKDAEGIGGQVERPTVHKGETTPGIVWQRGRSWESNVLMDQYGMQ